MYACMSPPLVMAPGLGEGMRPSSTVSDDAG